MSKKQEYSKRAEALECLSFGIRHGFYQVVDCFEAIGAFGDDGKASFRILRCLGAAGEPLTTAELMENLYSTRQYVQRETQKMMELGLVEKIDNPKHKRAYLLQPTAKGWEHYHRSRDVYMQFFESFPSDFSQEEIKQTYNMLTSFIERFRDQQTKYK